MEHEIIAWEPVIEKSKWVYEDDELKQIYSKAKTQPDIPQMKSYECTCGETFDHWDAAVGHLYNP